MHWIKMNNKEAGSEHQQF